ncbi:hypothetical protein ACI3L1_19250 [Deinococcus sp. SM5_A1]|jgi:hypothetical protein|uniref:hypothetical protein n=1 Tax=Deinococcus sp. SM5_A1 TaxID=3379094 RepID=UPI00385FFA98
MLQERSIKLPESLRRSKVKIELFASNLMNPSHMEWMLDGRLLVSEHTTGQVIDITKGGDMRGAKPFAWGLKGPASMLPLEDGRILISETWGGRIKDISSGGDVSELEPFAYELEMPYTLGFMTKPDGSPRITASESFGPFHTQNTDVTQGGGRQNHVPYVMRMPSIPGSPGLTPVDLPNWAEKWENFAAAGCTKSWTTMVNNELFVAIGAVGQVLKVPEGGGDYLELVDSGHLAAWGLQRLGGMKGHPVDGLIYAVQPEFGNVIAFDPDEPANQRFQPPVVQGLNFPTCPRFSEDGDIMYVCSSGDGVIWKVTNYL